MAISNLLTPQPLSTLTANNGGILGGLQKPVNSNLQGLGNKMSVGSSGTVAPPMTSLQTAEYNAANPVKTTTNSGSATSSSGGFPGLIKTPNVSTNTSGSGLPGSTNSMGTPILTQDELNAQNAENANKTPAGGTNLGGGMIIGPATAPVSTNTNTNATTGTTGASTGNNTSLGGITSGLVSTATTPNPLLTKDITTQSQLPIDYAAALANAGNAPGIAGAQEARQSNLTNAYGSEMQGLGANIQGLVNLQGTQQTGLASAGQLASPSNTNVTPPAGEVTTNTVTGQQYSNPIYGAPGMLQPYSPQPGGTTGQPATAGQTPPYTIKAGDTFYSIANGNRDQINAIEAANPGVDPNNLQPGQQINMPSATSGTNTPFTGGQAQGAAQQGAQYQANNATIIKAQGIQQKMNAEIVQNGINSLSSVNIANALNQWIQGNLSNPAYQNFFQDLTDYTQTIAPLIGISGTITDMKTGIAQNLISSTASGYTIMQGLNNLNTLALNSNEALLKAGSAAVGQGATPTGQNTGVNSGGSTYTASDGHTYSTTQNPDGTWTVKY